MYNIHTREYMCISMHMHAHMRAYIAAHSAVGACVLISYGSRDRYRVASLATALDSAKTSCVANSLSRTDDIESLAKGWIQRRGRRWWKGRKKWLLPPWNEGHRNTPEINSSGNDVDVGALVANQRVAQAVRLANSWHIA